MKRLPSSILISLLIAILSQPAAAAVKLPPVSFVKRQVEMAGYNYNQLISPKKVFKKTKLRIYTFFNSRWIDTWKAMVNEYRKFQPNVEVQFVSGPSNYQEKLYTMIVANVQPEIVMTEVGHVPYFLGNGLVLPLNSFIKADKWTRIIDQTFPTIIDRFTDEGKLYGMPTDTAPQACVYYNKNLFAAAGLGTPHDDWTLDEMLIYAKKLTQPAKKVWGFYTPDWKSVVYTHGGYLVDNYKKPTKFIYDSPKARAGFDWYISLWQRHKVCLDPTKAGDPATNFTGSKLAMYTNGVWDSDLIAKKKGLEWDVARFPRLNEGTPSKVRTGGTALCIVKGTKNQEVSWDLIKFLTGPIGQVYTSTSGYAQPAIESMFWTEIWAKNESMEPKNKKMLAEATRNVVYEPDTPVWPDIDAVLNNELNKVWTGRQTIAQAISTSLPQCQRLMDEAWARRKKARAGR